VAPLYPHGASSGGGGGGGGGRRGPFRFLNSGGIMGAAGALLAMLTAYETCFLDDQRCFVRYMLEHPGRVAVDEHARIFFNLHRVSGTTLTFAPGTGQLRVALTGSEPCVMHGNGGAGVKQLLAALVDRWRRARQEQRTFTAVLADTLYDEKQ